MVPHLRTFLPCYLASREDEVLDYFFYRTDYGLDLFLCQASFEYLQQGGI